MIIPQGGPSSINYSRDNWQGFTGVAPQPRPMPPTAQGWNRPGLGIGGGFTLPPGRTPPGGPVPPGGGGDNNGFINRPRPPWWPNQLPWPIPAPANRADYSGIRDYVGQLYPQLVQMFPNRFGPQQRPGPPGFLGPPIRPPQPLPLSPPTPGPSDSMLGGG